MLYSVKIYVQVTVDSSLLSINVDDLDFVAFIEGYEYSF